MILEEYLKQVNSWPESGRHIMAQFDANYVIVYQAFCPSIAEYAIKHQRFGGVDYKFSRMSWIKPNFLWMMYRSGWGMKAFQERILAIYITVAGFEWILKNSYTIEREKKEGISRDDVNVRLQWDPDHDVHGVKVSRRAIQLGLKNLALHKFNNEFIHKIVDITDIVKEQHQLVLKNQLEHVKTPLEHIYIPKDKDICSIIDLYNDLCSKESYETQSK